MKLRKPHASTVGRIYDQEADPTKFRGHLAVHEGGKSDYTSGPDNSDRNNAIGIFVGGGAALLTAAVISGAFSGGGDRSMQNTSSTPNKNKPKAGQTAPKVQEYSDRSHTVSGGDIVSQIAEDDADARAAKQASSEEPNDSDVTLRTQEIAEASGLADPDEIMPGQVLKIPGRSDVIIRVTPKG